MCLAIPMQLVQREGFGGKAELRGVRRSVGLMLCPEARVGDWVLVHAGYVIGTVDQEAAEQTLGLLDEALRVEGLP